MSYRVNGDKEKKRKELSDDAENNTAVASAGSKNLAGNFILQCFTAPCYVAVERSCRRMTSVRLSVRL